MWILFYLKQIHVSFNKRVFFALIVGGFFGAMMQAVYSPSLIQRTLNVYSIVSVGYIRLLQMLIYPVVVFSILSAITKIGENTKIGKAIALIILILLATTGIAAFIAIIITLIFKLNLTTLSHTVADTNAIAAIGNKSSLLDKPIYSTVTDFITTNPFADLTGARSNSIASLVVFFILIGLAYLEVRKKEPLSAEKFKSGIDVINKIIMQLVSLVLRLTPYGIFAIFCKVTATSNWHDVFSLLHFIIVTYITIIGMFVVHSILIASFGFNIFTYYKKVFALLIFAFTSRSSAASIPFNIEVQHKELGVSESIASASASFGAILGQNGCAGVYPAILAICIAPTMGLNPTDPQFILSLIGVVIVSSFGIAGVGGGATIAAIAVLSTFNMPLTLIALLIAIDPIVDMGRTALNVSGSLTAGLITAKLTKEINTKTFNSSVH